MSDLPSVLAIAALSVRENAARDNEVSAAPRRFS